MKPDGPRTPRTGIRVRRALTAAQVVAAAVALNRIAKGARRLPPLDPRPGLVDGVTVVIPARNEAERIGPCLTALAADPQVAAVIVVDDESTDGTAELAASMGARVVPGRALPQGWVGKPWALQQGLDAATTPWVLTLDADVVPQPGLIGSLLDTAVTNGWEMVSAGPRFVCRDPAQRWLHASMLATLVYRFGPVGPPTPPRPRRAVGNGQCVLVRRQWLAERGGFAVTGGHMTDDLALARWLAATGASIGFVDGSHVVEVEMHRSAREVWREWGRSLPMPDVTAPADQAADLAVVWLVMALPVLRLLGRRSTALDKALLAVRFGILAALRTAYTESGPALWMSWLADPATAVRLTQGALRPVRTWRDRTYG
ncbi:MAG: glycosyltransferase family 2 protein [Acidimicrobiales bacterium]